MKLEDVKILVTGAHGFLGGLFVRLLKAKRISHQTYDHRTDAIPDSGYTCIVHFAGLTPHSFSEHGTIRDSNFQMSNVEGTKAILATARKNRELEKFINIGSFAEYGFSPGIHTEGSPELPVGAYAKTKLEQTNLVRAFAEETGIRTINLRVANIAGFPIRTLKSGSRASVFESLARQFEEGQQEIEVTNVKTVRDYVDPDDIMKAVLAAIRSDEGETYELINICSGRAVSLGELAGIFGAISGNARPIRSTTHEMTRSVGSPRKAMELLGWEPKVPLEKSVRRTLKQDS